MAFVGRDLLFPQESQRSAPDSGQEPKKARHAEGTPKWDCCVAKPGKLRLTVWRCLLPRPLMGFALAGLIQQVIHEQPMQKWMGHEAGIKGMMIRSLIGMVLPGGPFTSFICSSPARECPARAWEYPLLGGELLVIRGPVSVLVPLLAGIVGQRIYLVFFHP